MRKRTKTIRVSPNSSASLELVDTGELIRVIRVKNVQGIDAGALNDLLDSAWKWSVLKKEVLSRLRAASDMPALVSYRGLFIDANGVRRYALETRRDPDTALRDAEALAPAPFPLHCIVGFRTE